MRTAQPNTTCKMQRRTCSCHFDRAIASGEISKKQRTKRFLHAGCALGRNDIGGGDSNDISVTRTKQQNKINHKYYKNAKN